MRLKNITKERECYPLGARGWTRTSDLLLMRQTSYQLLHSAMVAPVGFEPRLLVMGQVSCHCSTSAIFKGGIFFRSEPPRPHMKGNENRISGWCQWVGSNHRPMTYEAIALTN